MKNSENFLPMTGQTGIIEPDWDEYFASMVLDGDIWWTNVLGKVDNNFSKSPLTTARDPDKFDA